jgi:WD40 repeat protein
MRRMLTILLGLVLFPLSSLAQDKKLPEIVTVEKTGVISVAFSPDGKTLASGSAGRPPRNELKLWDSATGELKASLTGHTDHVLQVTFSPDGKTLATFSYDKTVRTWDVEAGKEKAVVLRDDTQVKAIRFSTDGNTLGVAGQKKVRLLDAATGKEQSSVNIHPMGFGYCFSPTLDLMAYAPDASYIHLVDTSNSKTKTLLTGLKGTTRAMRFSDDGKWLASDSDDNLLRVWDVAGGKLKTSFASEFGWCVALRKDGKYVAFGTTEGRARIWDVTANKELPSFQDKSLANVHSLAFSPDGKTLAAGGMGKVRLWSLDAK